MTVHDELILQLIKPDQMGKPTGFIINIVGTSKIEYKLEELFRRQERAQRSLETIVEDMTPDVFVRVRDSGKTIAIELETDVQWDFGQSLRQIKKYRRNSRDFNLVVVIIPKEYVRFALLYRQEGFPVYLWRASRVWECMQCGNITVEERTVKPRCSVESCHSNEQRLKGLRDAFFEEFFPSPMGNKQ